MGRSKYLLLNLPKTCAFCPRPPVDAIDCGDERAVPVCAPCGGLRRAKKLATPSVRRPRVTRREAVAITRELRETARKGVL